MRADCTYSFPADVPCPALPWCGHEGNLPKPLPDPEQLDIYDVLGDE